MIFCSCTMTSSIGLVMTLSLLGSGSLLGVSIFSIFLQKTTKLSRSLPACSLSVKDIAQHSRCIRCNKV